MGTRWPETCWATYNGEINIILKVTSSWSLYPHSNSVLCLRLISKCQQSGGRGPWVKYCPDKQANGVVPTTVAARSKLRVCGRSLAGIVGSNPAGPRISVLSVVCCKVEISATDRSHAQRSPIECGVAECNRGNSWRKTIPITDLEPRGK